MNDEIKEILEFKENSDYKKLSCDEIAILKDYITNLQQENERLREELSKCTRKHWQSKCAEHCINEKLLQIKIDKAIEYIEKYWNKNCYYEDVDNCMTFCEYDKNDLLNILRGGNNV